MHVSILAGEVVSIYSGYNQTFHPPSLTPSNNHNQIFRIACKYLFNMYAHGYTWSRTQRPDGTHRYWACQFITVMVCSYIRSYLSQCSCLFADTVYPHEYQIQVWNTTIWCTSPITKPHLKFTLFPQILNHAVADSGNSIGIGMNLKLQGLKPWGRSLKWGSGGTPRSCRVFTYGIANSIIQEGKYVAID